MGKGQKRFVVSVSGTTLNVDNPWLQRPDVTSVYQIGGIPWVYRSRWFEFPQADTLQNRSLELNYEPTVMPATMDVKLRYDFQPPTVWKNPMTSAGGSGVRVDADKPDLVVDLVIKPDDPVSVKGLANKQLPGHRENSFSSGRQHFVQIEMAGVSNQDPQAIYTVAYVGAAGSDK
jgi:hypothetical protein